MTAIPTPSEPTDLTPAWFSAVLSAPITAARVADLGAFGLGGRLYQVALTCAAPALVAFPARVVVKLAPAEAAMRRRQDALGIYRAEVGFYADLAPTLGDVAPRCWFGAYAPADAHFAIVMEDLSAGWTGSDAAGLSPAEAVAVARALAALHRHGWQHAGQVQGVAWLPTWESNLARMADRLAAGMAPALHRFGHAIDARLQPLVAQLPGRLPTLPGMLTRRAITLVHGDIQPRNLLFTGAAAALTVALLDWGSVMCGPAALDICNLVSLCLVPEQRRAMQSRLLAAYGEALGPDAGYPAEELLHDYYLLMQYRLARSLLVGLVSAPGSDGEAMTRCNLHRVSAVLGDDAGAGH